MARRGVTKAGAPDELACEATIIAAAMAAGWLVHGTRTVRVGKGARAFATPVKGQPGFPDLVLLRPPVAYVVELKAPGNYPSAEQRRWLAAFRACGIDAEVIYVPTEMDALLELLARRP